MTNILLQGGAGGVDDLARSLAANAQSVAQAKIDDAPADGKAYVRKDGVWMEAPAGGSADTVEIPGYFDNADATWEIYTARKPYKITGIELRYTGAGAGTAAFEISSDNGATWRVLRTADATAQWTLNAAAGRFTITPVNGFMAPTSLGEDAPVLLRVVYTSTTAGTGTIDYTVLLAEQAAHAPWSGEAVTYVADDMAGSDHGFNYTNVGDNITPTHDGAVRIAISGTTASNGGGYYTIPTTAYDAAQAATPSLGHALRFKLAVIAAPSRSVELLRFKTASAVQLNGAGSNTANVGFIEIGTTAFDLEGVSLTFEIGRVYEFEVVWKPSSDGVAGDGRVQIIVDGTVRYSATATAQVGMGEVSLGLRDTDTADAGAIILSDIVTVPVTA